MGDAGPVSDERMLDRRASGRQTAGAGNTPRNRRMRGASERGGLAGCVVTKGLLSKVIELASLDITLELAVPGGPVVLQKPSAKLRQLVCRERLDLLLDLLDLAHDDPNR